MRAILLNNCRVQQWLWIVATLLPATVANAYVFILDPSNCVSTWRAGTIPLQIKLATTPVLADGSNYQTSVLAAMSEWNACLGTVQFAGTLFIPGSYELGNGTSEIVMDNNIGYGADAEPFDQYTLAITVGVLSSNFVEERDIVINTAYQWDSFRGGQSDAKQDIRRVVAHELGHVLGLDHPDENGQGVVALMNSLVSYYPSIEGPQADDIVGAQVLYGAPGFIPANDDFNQAVSVQIPDGVASYSGTNVAATKETGEPNLDPDDPGGRTVWWKWTADAGGSLTVTTTGSNFDTLLGAYTGTAPNALTQLALNDDIESGVQRQSTITIDVEAGTTYCFVVDGWGGYVGAIKLNFSLTRDPDHSPPYFTPRPLSRVLHEGSSVTIASGVAHTDDVSVAWKHNGVLIPTATGESLGLASAALSDAGFYEVTATSPRGVAHTYFRLTVAPVDATLTMWGDIPGNGSSVQVSDLSPVPFMDATEQVIVFAKANGELLRWGYASDSGFPFGVGGFVDASVDFSHGLGLRADGTLADWGTGSGVDLSVPEGLDQVIQVATGYDISVALRADGTVRTWGNTAGISQPVGLGNVVAIAAAGRNVAALRSDGTVVCWGAGNNGETTPPPGLTGVVAIASGGSGSYGGHVLALQSNGTVVAWGWNESGQCNVPLGLSDVVSIGAGDFNSYAIKADGSVIGWGFAAVGLQNFPSGIGQAVRVTGGARFALALVRPVPLQILSNPADVTINPGANASFTVSVSGTPPIAYQWEKDGVPMDEYAGRPTTRAPTLQILNASEVNSGTYRVKVSNASGSLYSGTAILNVAHPSPITVRPKSTTVLLGQTATFTVGASEGGPFVYSWRHNRQVIADATDATLEIGPATIEDAGYYEGIVRNAVGGTSSTVFYLAVAVENPEIVTWGSPSGPPPVIDAPVAAIDVGAVSMAVKSDGKVVAWGTDPNGLANIPADLTDVLAVSIGTSHVLALRSDGTVRAWGSNETGKATPPAGLTDVVAVCAGASHSIALKSDGTVVTWGNPAGWGTAVDGPQIPSTLKDVVAVRAPPGGYLALRSDGSVVGWQASGYPGGPPGSLAADSVAISGKGHQHFAVKADGTIVAWDYNELGVLPVSGAIDVAADETHYAVLRSDRTVLGYGYIGYEQIVIPKDLNSVAAVAVGPTSGMALVRSDKLSVDLDLPLQTVGEGEYFSLKASVKGAIPLNLQWQKDGVPIADGGGISGSRTDTLVFDPIRLADGGAYKLVVSNSRGTAGSSVVSVEVFSPPKFTHRPLSKLVKVGTSVTFDATASDSEAVTYLWKHDGNLIPGAAGATLQIPTAAFSDRGQYEVYASNSHVANWSTFRLTVSPADTTALAISAMLRSSDIDSSFPEVQSVATIAGGYNGGLVLTSEGKVTSWGSLQGLSIPSDLEDVVAITNGRYGALALRADGRVFPLTNYQGGLAPVPPDLRHVVSISGSPGLFLAAKADGTVVSHGLKPPPQGLGDVISVANATGYCMAIRADRSVTSWKSGQDTPTQPPEDLSGVVEISGSWNNGIALKANGTFVTWGEPDIEATKPGYLNDVVGVASGPWMGAVLRADGSVIAFGSGYAGDLDTTAHLSPTAFITGEGSVLALTGHLIPPVLTVQPVGGTVVEGDTLELQVEVDGRPWPKLQWQKDGADLPGANYSTLRFYGAKPADSGSYRLVATSSIGTVTSNAASVTVLERVAVPQFQPSTGTIVAGEAITISCSTPGATIRYTTDSSLPTESNGTIYTVPIVVNSGPIGIRAIATKAGMPGSYDNWAYYTVVSNSVPQILTASMPRGVAGKGYSTSLSGSGGNGALVWSVTSGSLPSGVHLSAGGVLSGTPTESGTFAFEVQVGDGDQFVGAGDESLKAFAITVDATDSVPSITTTTLADGGLAVAYSQALAATGGNGQLTWTKASGTLPSGLTLSPGGVISGIPGALGTYNFTVKVADDDTVTGAGDEDMQALTIKVLPSPRLVNVSMRALAGGGDDTLIVGFTIVGKGTKTVIIRGVGPKLSEYGVPVVVADPSIHLYKGNDIIDENDDWDAALAPDFAAVGAFALDVGSKDAALKAELLPGGYTIHLINSGSVAEALVEVYDESHNASSRLVNVSSRLKLAPGKNAILGTAVTGGPIYMLARNVGPGISQWLAHPTDALPDPYLKLYAGSNLVQQNDDWDISLAPFFVSSGAFALTEGSKDAAIRAQFQIGGYTVHATGTDGAGGITIIEIYESP